MSKRVLVIGGTYFSGRVFSIYASRRPDDYDLTLLNRGSHPLRRAGVEELVADRTDPVAVSAVLAERQFDVVVDFCAYRPGDIRSIVNSGVGFSRYIEVSTANVYDPLTPPPITEEAPRITIDALYARTDYPPELKGYLAGKRLLEDELTSCAAEHGFAYTILRPAFLYGPLDYTPRLRTYLQWIKRGEEVPFPKDSDSKFSFCYVKDFANLIFKVIESDSTCNSAYTVAAPDVMDWDRFEQVLSTLGDSPQTHVHLSVKEIDDRRIPIMFPIDTFEWYTGDRLAEAVGGFEFTTFDQGLYETWEAFKDLL